MDETQNTFIDQWITASRRMAELLEPEVRTEWWRELLAFHEAKNRGESYEMSPLARALTGAVLEHITEGTELCFPSEAAANYQTDLRQRFIDASAELAAMLEPEVFALWQAEWRTFIDAQERGESYVMTPLARALTGAIWEHITTGEELFFPPEAAAHYARAPRANTN